MKKISVLFIFLFSILPKAHATKTSHLSEQDYEQIFLQNLSLKEELDQQDPIFALACVGKTELQNYDPNKLLITNPISKRTILHYLAIFDHHQLLHGLFQKYHSLKQKINIPDSYGFTPLHYAMKNSSIECTQLLLHYSEHVTNQDEYGSIPVFDESLENCDELDTNQLCFVTSPQCHNNNNDFFDDKTTNLEKFVNDYITDYLNDPTLQKEISLFPDSANENDNKMYMYQESNNQLFNVKSHHFIEIPKPKSSEIVKKKKKLSSKYAPFYNLLTKKYECPHNNCKALYKRGSTLGQHMKNQHNNEIVKKLGSKYDQFYNPATQTYECPDCGKTYTQRNNLANHMKNQHNSEVKNYNRKYSKFYNSHIQQYVCPYYGKTYTEGDQLGQHMKNQHNNEIVKKGKKYSRKYTPFYNSQTKKYECPFNDCNKSYKQGSDLGNHMKNQHNSDIIKKFGSKYSQFYNSLSKKYGCPDCGKTYKEGKYLGQHMKNQHKSAIVKKRCNKYSQFYNSLSQEYECPDCEETYMAGSQLGRHMKHQHQKIIVKKDGTIKTIEIP